MSTHALVRWGVKGVILAVGILVAAKIAHAEQLKLRFTAKVATAANGLNPDFSTAPLPFNIAVGEVFDFHLTIENPSASATSPGNTSTFQAVIGGQQLIDDALRTTVDNDAPRFSMHLATMVDADSPLLIGDAIDVQPYEAPAFFGQVTNQPAIGFDTRILFLHLAERLPGPTTLNNTLLTQSAQTWQTFPIREIGLSFSNRSYLGALIETVVAVPEPGSVESLLVGISIWAGCLFTIRKLVNSSGQVKGTGNAACEIRSRAAATFRAMEGA